MDEQTAERLQGIFAKRISELRDQRYEVQGQAEEQRVKGRISAFEWSRDLMRDLGKEDSDEVLTELENRLDQDW